MESRLLDELEQGATVLSATNRLARTLRRAYQQRQLEAGRAAWPSPDALPWEAWLQRCWTDARDFAALPGMLLGPGQELTLWEAVMAADAELPEGFRVAGTAPLVQEAWTLVHQWRLDQAAGPGDSQEAAASVDASAFRRWRGAFERRLARGGWITRAQLPDRLAAAFREGALPPPRRLVLAGFDERSPQQAHLLDVLEALGTEVAGAPEPRPGSESPAARLAPYPDRDAEIRAAAAWARHELEAGAEGPVGIVVPDLGEVRAPLERALLDTFHDPLTHPERAPDELAFNLSLGQPLAEVPVLHAALSVLSLVVDELPITEAGALVRSPYLEASEAEAGARVRLDLRLRRRGGQGVDRSVVAQLAAATGAGGKPAAHGCPRLAGALGRARRRLEALPAHRPPSAWAETFADLLGDLGWPGERTLDSVEFQAVGAWRERVLEPMAALDGVSGPVPLHEALRRLRRLAGEAVFQPRSNPEAPVQVLGILEAAGLEFDRLWLLGMHEGAWPQPPRPNPFLPRRLQRQQGLPRATPERELAFAERTMQRLLASAPVVVASYPERGARDEELQPSPLVAGLAPEPAPPEASVPGRAWEERLRRAADLEPLHDPWGPPLGEEGPVPGGASLFRDQSACPFRAFAARRLGASAPEAPPSHPTPPIRGNLLHEALHTVWGELGDQATLRDCSPERLNQLCKAASRAAVDSTRREHPGLFGERAARLEVRRLTERLEQWLGKEAQRHTPFRVLDRELPAEAAVGGVNVKLQVDRVDELADGRWLVIDYKTGEADYRRWLGERPEEPQLPLYALALGEQVAGAAFVRLKPDLMDFSGLAADGIDEGSGGRGIKPADQAREAEGRNWAALAGDWRQVLGDLAEEIRTGKAAVAPRFGPGSSKSPCRTCPLPALCQIHHDDPGKDDLGGE
ncbi:PD-(D/E)XK nuclease family protein [Thiohalorhabdus sp. Cl-TMA]|uniref:PD-(D/E)XK nuclease family protein n=1 Tax=Thiohalorhabdus methylotrophus TaxID=3242694 RepID=A0ABV4TSZ5_9GAMM